MPNPLTTLREAVDKMREAQKEAAELRPLPVTGLGGREVMRLRAAAQQRLMQTKDAVAEAADLFIG